MADKRADTFAVVSPTAGYTFMGWEPTANGGQGDVRNVPLSLLSESIPYGTTTLKGILDDLTYVAPSVTLSIANALTIDFGQTVTQVNLSWTTNKPDMTFNLNNSVGTVTGTSYQHNTSFVNTSRTYTLTASDGQNNTSSSKTITVSHRRRSGVSDQLLPSSFVLSSFASEFAANSQQTKTFNPNNQYIFVCLPAIAGWGEPSFKVNGLLNTAWEKTSYHPFTNPYGYDYPLNLYRSTNKLTGTYTVEVL